MECRRSEDTVIDMIREQIDHVTGGLEKHITSCVRMQKTQILIGCAVLLLVEAHSPEAAKVIGKLVEMFIP